MNYPKAIKAQGRPGRERGCKVAVSLNRSQRDSPSPPFKGERERPAKREGEVGGATNRHVGPPHPTLSPRPAVGEGQLNLDDHAIAVIALYLSRALSECEIVEWSRRRLIST